MLVSEFKMKSKSKIEKQLSKKTDSYLVETIILAKKNKGWQRVAELLSTPRKKRREINVGKISEMAKDGETIIVPGKVLSLGELNKKVKVVALSFSETAREKILRSKGETLNILEEIKNNPKASGIKILE